MQRHSIGLTHQQQNSSAEGREGSKVREKHLAGSVTVSDYPSPLSDCLQGRDTEGRPYMSTNASMPLGLGGGCFVTELGRSVETMVLRLILFLALEVIENTEQRMRRGYSCGRLDDKMLNILASAS